MAQAYAAGDPLAQEDKAMAAVADIVGNPQLTEEMRAAKVKVVQDNVRAAVESGDPEALYRAGLMFAPPLVNDAMPGFAVALAACELGYAGCTTANPENPGHECAQAGRCPPGQDFPTMLQRGMSPAQYAQLYARSQQIVLAVRARDYDAVLANLTIKHP